MSETIANSNSLTFALFPFSKGEWVWMIGYFLFPYPDDLIKDLSTNFALLLIFPLLRNLFLIILLHPCSRQLQHLHSLTLSKHDSILVQPQLFLPFFWVPGLVTFFDHFFGCDGLRHAALNKSQINISVKYFKW